MNHYCSALSSREDCLRKRFEVVDAQDDFIGSIGKRRSSGMSAMNMARRLHALSGRSTRGTIASSRPKVI